MTSLARRFSRNQSGATAVEYGLIATLISIAIIAGALALGTAVGTAYDGGDETAVSRSAE